jgi:trk system potassium uptake protein TrkH
MKEKPRPHLRSRRVIHMARSAIKQAPRRMPAALQLVLGLLLLIAIGTGLLQIKGAATHPLTFMEALFTSTSASAVTGLSLFPISTVLTQGGQIVLLILAQIGGVSLIVAVSAVFYILGRRVTLSDRLAVTTSLGLDNPRQIMQIMIRAILLMVIIEGVGAFLLFLHWLYSGIVPPGQAAFYAIFHAVMSFCNAGFDLFSGLPQYPNGLPSDPLSLLIMGTLIFLGGLGIPVYMNIIFTKRRRRFSLHTRLTLVISLALILVGTAGLLVTEYRQAGVLSGMSPFQRVTLALFQSISTRTAGFASLPGFSQMNFASIFLLIVLMMIGTAPASTGGGITTGTFAVLWFAVLSYARGYDRVRIWKRTLPTSLIQRAMVVLMMSLTLVFVATWLLLITNPFPLSESLFEAVSAYSTTGLSLGITPGLNNFGRWIIIGMMFCGRLGSVTIMVALLGREPRRKLLEYPEEPILIG